MSSSRIASTAARSPGRERGVGDHRRGATLLHPARVRGLVVGGGVRIRDEDRREPVLGELEDRPARPGDGEVGGREREAEGDEVVAQVVVRAGGGEVGEVAPAGDVEDAVGRVGERGDGGVVDAARAERAAEDEHAALLRADPELLPRTGAVGDARRDRAAGDAVAVAGAAREREGEADARGAGREQAIAQPEVRVGLGEDERDPQRQRRGADRAGDVAAAPQHRVRAAAPEDRAGVLQRQRGLRDRAGRLQRVAAADPLDPDRVERVARGGNELGLGALAADEADLRALSPQRVGHRDGRHHVSGRPAGRDHDPWCAHPSSPSAAAARRRAGGRSRRSRRSAAAPSRAAA